MLYISIKIKNLRVSCYRMYKMIITSISNPLQCIIITGKTPAIRQLSLTKKNSRTVAMIVLFMTYLHTQFNWLTSSFTNPAIMAVRKKPNTHFRLSLLFHFTIYWKRPKHCYKQWQKLLKKCIERSTSMVPT